MTSTLFAVVAAAILQPTGGSPLAPPPNHLRSGESAFHAFTNATIHAGPGRTFEHATLVIRDGIIVSLQAAPAPGGDGRPIAPPAPAGARVWDCTGLHIFPGFLDPFVEVDAPATDPANPSTHWNPRVTPDRSVLAGPGIPEAAAKELRDLGFVAAGLAPRGGLFRGLGASVSLAQAHADPSIDRPPVYNPASFAVVSFDAGGGRGGRVEAEVGRWTSYPNSLMGSIALIRQTFSDADWLAHARAAGEVFPPSPLDALGRFRGPDGRPTPTAPPVPSGVSAPPMFRYVFDTRDELDALRALKIAAEADRAPVILGSGTEFRRLAALEKAGKPLVILPLNFPRPPDVSTVARADAVELRELMTWEQAPTNPRRLDAARFHIALTTAKLRSRSEFRDNLLKAVKHGLPRDRALAALTSHPAIVMGVGERLGSLDPGKIASFILADADLLALPEPDSKKPAPKIRDVWIDGIRHEVNPAPSLSLEGRWDISLPDAPPIHRALVIDADLGITLERGDKSVKCSKVRLVGQTLSFLFDHEPLDGQPGLYSATAAVSLGDDARPVAMIGTLALPSGQILQWSASFAGKTPADPEAAFLGSWRIVEADGNPIADDAPGTPVLTIAKDKKLSLLSDDGSTITPSEVAYEGNSLSYKYESAPGLWTDTCTLEGDTLVGESLAPSGVRHRWKARKQPEPPKSPAGRYRMATIDGQPYTAPETLVTITSSGVVRVTMSGVGFTLGRDVKLDGAKAAYILDMTPFGGAGDYTISAQRTREALSGSFTQPDGSEHTFTATPITPPAPEEVPETIAYPFGPYALPEPPPQRTVIFQNATIWTSTPAGILRNAWLVIEEGKIVAVGSGPMDVTTRHTPITIDATGLHITPGLIDAHSHTGISRGVNESGQAVTAEVRIQDVTNPDDVSWYRQLAGGVTTVNSMHGSANAIGGQTQTNKNRWGALHPDDMHMDRAMPGIKFALGENVKQSNWGDGNTTRYPQTRMGVESIIRDRFTAAREYAAADNPRRDLELDALAEILAGERLVHCHSYRQDEILMLARIARDFGFRIGSFQHGLECYKVAEAVRESSIGASLFSDWWAYKVEGQDAIPQAGPILHEQGVVVSFNSDSDELARRMNVEAAKAVKYGDLSPEDALKFVTLNPALQLGIADRVGSLEPGKDADLALWSGDPLSAFSRCVSTFVDGRELFSLELDARHRAAIASERERLIQKILAADSPRADAAPAPRGRRTLLEQAWLDARRAHYLRRLERGEHESAHRCGECGMNSF